MSDTSIARPADVVSPITDGMLPYRTSLAEARATGRHGYDKPTPANSVVLLVDHQIGADLGHARQHVACGAGGQRRRAGRTARGARDPDADHHLERPLAKRRYAPRDQGDLADQPIHRRTGIINCYEDPSFRSAFEKISGDRRHVIIAAVTIGTCCALPTLSMLNDGYAVHPVVDACGAWNRYEAKPPCRAWPPPGPSSPPPSRSPANSRPIGSCRRRTRCSSPSSATSPSTAFLIQHFWDNANGRTVPDPFGMVK